jgi:FkbM family methyltransferase
MKKAVRNLVSRPSLQPIAMQVLKLCHAAMNYGGGQTVNESGELEALRFVQGLVLANPQSPFILFDVGANDGAYLQSALPILGTNARAWSFEPQSACFKILSHNFANDHRVVLRNLALSDRQEAKEIFYDAAGDTTASFHHHTGGDLERCETVPGTTLDEICQSEGIDRIHFLKIDTEGHEMQVLRGAAGMLQKGAIRAIQFEFGDTFLNTDHHFIDLWQLLSPDFRIFRILRHGLHELKHYSSDLEIYKIANFLCVHR